MTPRKTLLAVQRVGALLGISLFLAAPAGACWDGLAYEAPGIRLVHVDDCSNSDDAKCLRLEWTPWRAKRVAQGLRELQALLPRRAKLKTDYGEGATLTISRPGRAPFEATDTELWDGSFDKLRRFVIKSLRRAGLPVRSVKVAESPVYTLSLGTFTRKEEAEDFLYRLNREQLGLPLDGFLRGAGMKDENGLRMVPARIPSPSVGPGGRVATCRRPGAKAPTSAAGSAPSDQRRGPKRSPPRSVESTCRLVDGYRVLLGAYLSQTKAARARWLAKRYFVGKGISAVPEVLPLMQ